jgi:hypothetical protein
MIMRSILISYSFAVLLTVAPLTLLAHHNAPEELQDFITEQLIDADSPHLLTSDDDPSLLDTEVVGMEDLDYVVVTDGLSADETTDALEEILEQLATENDVCDVNYQIDYDTDLQTFSLTVNIDFCSQ